MTALVPSKYSPGTAGRTSITDTPLIQTKDLFGRVNFAKSASILRRFMKAWTDSSIAIETGRIPNTLVTFLSEYSSPSEIASTQDGSNVISLPSVVLRVAVKRSSFSASPTFAVSSSRDGETTERNLFCSIVAGSEDDKKALWPGLRFFRYS